MLHPKRIKLHNTYVVVSDNGVRAYVRHPKIVTRIVNCGFDHHIKNVNLIPSDQYTTIPNRSADIIDSTEYEHGTLKLMYFVHQFHRDQDFIQMRLVYCNNVEFIATVNQDDDDFDYTYQLFCNLSDHSY